MWKCVRLRLFQLFWLLTIILIVCCDFCLCYTLSSIDVHSRFISVTEKDLNPRHLGHLLFNEQHKILFCPIEKVMSTQFRQLFDRLAGDPIWWQNPYHKSRSHSLIQQKSIEEIQEILNDPSWIKAIFFRDPATRLLSSYLHLIKTPNALHRYKTMLFQRNLTVEWEDFIESVLETNGLDNVHWNAQTNFCGFNKFSSLFNFIGNYELIRDHGPLLAQITHIENYTSQGWSMTKNMKYLKNTNNNRGGGAMISFPIPPEFNHNDCMWCRNNAPHKSNYELNPQSKYLTPKILNKIRWSDKYRQDYEIFSQIHSIPFNFSLYNHHQFEQQTS